MNKSLDEARNEIRKSQLKMIKDFRNRGWNDIADKMEKELKSNKTFSAIEDGNFEKR